MTRYSIFNEPIKLHWVHPSTCVSFWAWLWCSWSFVGGWPPRRIIGCRRFGYEWEKHYQLPPGIIVM